ncbi:ABC transporter ATP-binding protein [Glutamicibacter sp. NPDC087344]|uniref:ABC transporter ATP-binding protein n=1 Tax=Glutamicibacter sp. NPDC087344 TaxID=3363994 RepID=UPI0037FAB805
MIALESLSVNYGSQPVLQGIDLEVPAGKITTILGPNGSGKSTILKTVAGLLTPAKGLITLQGKSLSSFSRRELARSLCLVSQRHEAPSDLTVEELVAFGRYPHHRWFSTLTAEDRAIIDDSLEHTGLQHLRLRQVNQLSGGESQKAWIAMALAQRPKILLLDEPTTYLDIAHQLEVLNLVVKINQEQKLTVVMVLHDLNHASAYSDQLIMLRHGQVVGNGAPSQILTHQMLNDVYQVRAEITQGADGATRIHPIERI